MKLCMGIQGHTEGIWRTSRIHTSLDSWTYFNFGGIKKALRCLRGWEVYIQIIWYIYICFILWLPTHLISQNNGVQVWVRNTISIMLMVDWLHSPRIRTLSRKKLLYILPNSHLSCFFSTTRTADWGFVLTMHRDILSLTSHQERMIRQDKTRQSW